MARNKGKITLVNNYKVELEGALDPRVAVESKEELINLDTWPNDGKNPYLYNGLIVGVRDESSAYILIDKNNALSPDYSGWEKISGNSEDLSKRINQILNIDFNLLLDAEELKETYISANGELKSKFVYNNEEYTTPTKCYIIQNKNYKKIQGKASYYKYASNYYLGFYNSTTPDSFSFISGESFDGIQPKGGISFILDVPEDCKTIVISSHESYNGLAECIEKTKLEDEFVNLYKEIDLLKNKIQESSILVNEVTYQQFIQLKEENKLIPGKKYKIIDYKTWVGENQYNNVIETNNIIPITVTAITENTIDEIAETEDAIIRINIFNSYKYKSSETKQLIFSHGSIDVITDYTTIEFDNEQYVELKKESEYSYIYIKDYVYNKILNNEYNQYTPLNEYIYIASDRFEKFEGSLLIDFPESFEIVPPKNFDRGMGEILWMKDKNGNSAPWDFKSIKWKFNSDNLPKGFDTTIGYLTFDDYSFNNTILIDELTSPVILKNSYNNIINVKNSSLICIDSADNDIFVENNDNHNKINNINKSIIKLSNDKLNYVKKLSEGLFLETQDQLLDDMLNYNNEIVINEPLTGSVSFNIKGQCSLDFKIGSGSELPTIEFSGVKFIKELDLVEDTRYLILFDQKIQNNNKTDIVAIWAAVSNT